MHSHIGCICSTFLHCVFSNVFSNCLPERMHNHIGYICLTFLHCAFSNVSLNCLPEWRHNHIGCIFLTFLHCVFSNVSSNDLLEKRRNCIGLQMACLRKGIVTLVALVSFFSTVVFQMYPQIAWVRGCIITMVACV